MALPFGDLGVALVTLFAPNGDVDTTATASHPGVQASFGVRFVLVCGGTGEAAALTEVRAAKRFGVNPAMRRSPRSTSGATQAASSQVLGRRGGA